MAQTMPNSLTAATTPSLPPSLCSRNGLLIVFPSNAICFCLRSERAIPQAIYYPPHRPHLPFVHCGRIFGSTSLNLRLSKTYQSLFTMRVANFIYLGCQRDGSIADKSIRIARVSHVRSVSDASGHLLRRQLC